MERYEAYKDSGVEWVGEVPASWVVQRFRWTLERVNRLPLDDDEIITCFRDGEVTLRSNRREDGFTMSDKEIGYQHICAGDFVIHGMDGFAGAMGISDSDGKASPVLMVFRPIGNHDLRYINYLLRLYAWRNVFLSLSTTIRVRSCDLNWAKVAPLPMVLPNHKEQQAIADYLDAKTAEIDALVADCEREVELLREYRKAVISEAVTKGLDPDVPMKDSGIEWIGEIPETWLCSSLSRVIKAIQTGPFGSQLHAEDYLDDGEVCVVNPANIIGGKIAPSSCNRISKDLADSLSQHLMHEGEIVFGRRGEMGRCALVEEDGLFCGTGSIEMELLETIIPSFAVYYLQCDFVKSYLELRSVGTTLQNLNTAIIASTPFVVAPIEEQRAIVAYLNDKTAEIDSLIEAKQSMADKLREYRRSLISEAVTGKFKVPGL